MSNKDCMSFYFILGNIVKGDVHISNLPDHLLDQQPTHEELISHARTAEWNVLGVKLGLNSVDLAGCHDYISMYQVCMYQVCIRYVAPLPLWKKEEEQQEGVY